MLSFADVTTCLNYRQFSVTQSFLMKSTSTMSTAITMSTNRPLKRETNNKDDHRIEIHHGL